VKPGEIILMGAGALLVLGGFGWVASYADPGAVIIGGIFFTAFAVACWLTRARS
jgi:hypothetical protein